MRSRSEFIDIFLQPGEFYFGDVDTRIHTLLGSCVAMTLWHPEKRLGAMCHCLLPKRDGKTTEALDGRYVDEALATFLQEATRNGTDPYDYEVKLFGGGNMFAHLNQRPAVPIGEHNIRYARQLLNHLGFRVVAQHVGGAGHRNVIFDVWSGHVWMRYQKTPSPDMTEARSVAW